MSKYKLYECGGCVRDAILHIKSKDIDYSVVFNNTAEFQSHEHAFKFLSDDLKSQGYEIFLETPDCFTIRARFPETSPHKGITADFVIARKELYYPSDSRTPVVELGTLHDDLIRRDFTVNSIAKDFDGNIIDLFDGIKDLNDGILRTPTDAVISLHADPLRILRAFRFHITKNLSFSDELANAICLFDYKRLKLVSTERIREELFKMFKHSTYGSLQIFYWLRKENPDLYNHIFTQRGISLEPTLKK